MASSSVPVFCVIGGTGLYTMPEFETTEMLSVDTPYGKVEDVVQGTLKGRRVIFIARHGRLHAIPPHKINYRANMWALKSLGGEWVLAANAVGGISDSTPPGALVVPEQIIDYTSGREHTYADSLSGLVNHVDFTYPYSSTLRNLFGACLTSKSVPFEMGGVYAACQGPRLETAAEIRRLERDGCTVVGMTGMPEAALARELAMQYASVCPVVNWAAGKATEVISVEQIRAVLEHLMPIVRDVIVDVIQNFDDGTSP